MQPNIPPACGELLFIRSARLPAQFCGPGLGIRPCDPALASARPRPAKPTVALLLSRGSSTAPPSLYRILRAAGLPLVPASTVDFAPRPIPLHTQTSQTSLLPFKLVRLLRASLCSVLRQPSAALPLRPFVVLRPRTSLLPFTFCPPSHVPAVRPVILYHFPHSHISANRRCSRMPPLATLNAILRASRAKPDLSATLAVPLHSLRASTARPFAFLLISCLPLPLSLRFAPPGKTGHRAHSVNASVTQLPPHRPLPFPSTVVRPVMLCRRPAHRCNPR